MPANDGFSMMPVQSTQIAEMGHNPQTNQARVVFASNGAVYDYDNVTADEFDQIVNAPSVGSAFNASWKYGKPYRRVN